MGDAGGTWNVINDVLNRNRETKSKDISLLQNGILINNNEQIANIFNEYFSKIGTNLSNNIENIDNISAEDFFHVRQNASIQIQLTDEDEIIELVSDLSDASGGPDTIPTKIMKQVIHTIITPLTHICNISLTTGIFPQHLKLSKITPLHKQGNKQLYENYRPISILNCFSKILEKLMFNRLNKFFNDNDILIPNQHGFTKSKSTTSAILQLTDYVLKSFDQKKFVIGIFLDFKKAFDTVDHNILLTKLENYGIRDITLKWVTSYLSDRKHFTQIGDQKSQTLTLTHSIPQGSILGPLLFNIYINDLINCTNKLELILFADDSCFYTSNHNLTQLIENANLELNNIKNWTIANKLTLNIDKSHYIIFKRRRKLPTEIPQLNINNLPLELVEDTKFLGLIVQSDLKWNQHIKILTNKLHKYSSIIYLIKHCLDKNSLKQIYYGLVYSFLVYANVIWGKSPMQHLKPLITAQKRIIRTIMNRDRLHHTNLDFYNLGFLKFQDIITYFASIFVFKSLNEFAHPFNYFNTTGNEHHYNLRNSQNLRPPLTLSLQSQSSPSYYCCSIWNNLPEHIKNRTSVASFKFGMKQHLLSSYL